MDQGPGGITAANQPDGVEDLTVEELRVNRTRAANWKSPGPDRLPNFWIKQFKSLPKPMTEAYSESSRTQSKLQTG